MKQSGNNLHMLNLQGCQCCCVFYFFILTFNSLVFFHQFSRISLNFFVLSNTSVSLWQKIQNLKLKLSSCFAMVKDTMYHSCIDYLNEPWSYKRGTTALEPFLHHMIQVINNKSIIKNDFDHSALLVAFPNLYFYCIKENHHKTWFSSLWRDDNQVS